MKAKNTLQLLLLALNCLGTMEVGRLFNITCIKTNGTSIRDMFLNEGLIVALCCIVSGTVWEKSHIFSLSTSGFAFICKQLRKKRKKNVHKIITVLNEP